MKETASYPDMASINGAHGARVEVTAQKTLGTQISSWKQKMFTSLFCDFVQVREKVRGRFT